MCTTQSKGTLLPSAVQSDMHSFATQNLEDFVNLILPVNKVKHTWLLTYLTRLDSQFWPHICVGHKGYSNTNNQLLQPMYAEEHLWIVWSSRRPHQAPEIGKTLLGLISLNFWWWFGASIWNKQHQTTEWSCLVSMAQAAKIFSQLLPVGRHAVSQSSDYLRLVSRTWQWIHSTQMTSIVTSSQSNRAPLWCGETKASHYVQPTNLHQLLNLQIKAVLKADGPNPVARGT